MNISISTAEPVRIFLCLAGLSLLAFAGGAVLVWAVRKFIRNNK